MFRQKKQLTVFFKMVTIATVASAITYTECRIWMKFRQNEKEALIKLRLNNHLITWWLQSYHGSLCVSVIKHSPDYVTHYDKQHIILSCRGTDNEMCMNVVVKSLTSSKFHDLKTVQHSTLYPYLNLLNSCNQLPYFAKHWVGFGAKSILLMPSGECA